MIWYVRIRGCKTQVLHHFLIEFNLLTNQYLSALEKNDFVNFYIKIVAWYFNWWGVGFTTYVGVDSFISN